MSLTGSSSTLTGSGDPVATFNEADRPRSSHGPPSASSRTALANSTTSNPRKPRTNPLPHASSVPSLQKRPWGSESRLDTGHPTASPGGSSIPSSGNRRPSGGSSLRNAGLPPAASDRGNAFSGGLSSLSRNTSGSSASLKSSYRSGTGGGGGGGGGITAQSKANSYPSLRQSSSAPALNRGKAAIASAKKALKEQYEVLLSCRNPSEPHLRDSLRKLRMMVICNGVPDLDEPTSLSKPTNCSLRGKVWKALLGIYRVSALEYVTLVGRGPCEVYDKIKNDTFRTLATDTKFMRKVNEGMIARVLNAFVWKAKDPMVNDMILPETTDYDMDEEELLANLYSRQRGPTPLVPPASASPAHNSTATPSKQSHESVPTKSTEGLVDSSSEGEILFRSPQGRPMNSLFSIPPVPSSIPSTTPDVLTTAAPFSSGRAPHVLALTVPLQHQLHDLEFNDLEFPEDLNDLEVDGLQKKTGDNDLDIAGEEQRGETVVVVPEEISARLKKEYGEEEEDEVWDF
ncbi:hypothetical protein HDU96_003324 [Phlyctochytrium bullatum]|nr:hypothetical protein HDU96_003324 [Phlyctochytrium bullatum]